MTKLLIHQYGHRSTFWDASSTQRAFKYSEEINNVHNRDDGSKDFRTPHPHIASPGKTPPPDEIQRQHKVDRLTAMVEKVSDERTRRMIVKDPGGGRSTRIGAKELSETSGESRCGLSASSVAKLLVSLIKTVLGASQQEAIQIALQRCAQIDADVRSSILLLETTSEVVEEKESKTRDMGANTTFSTHATSDDLLTALTLMEQKGPHGAKQPNAAAKWPSGEIRIKDVQNLCPTGARLRALGRRQLYQMSYHGSTCSRCWQRYGHAESLRLVVKWAWERHTAFTGTECNIKGIFPCFAAMPAARRRKQK